MALFEGLERCAQQRLFGGFLHDWLHLNVFEDHPSPKSIFDGFVACPRS
jgi:hypothetical protein